MPAKSERAKVEIKESSTLDVRTFDITLTVPASDFQLTDLLRQRGVINALDAELKQAVKGATERYLKTAETLISGLVTKPTVGRKPRPNSNDNGKSADAFSGA
ncbi:MAG: hypothetical protein M3410_04155 [Acidobacteriota bacterium]|nr:hypothetical protein [Acidobacteriota bacterium]